ncbi:MAG: hypothetical protein JWO20_1210 [Candidatus Angelobacter sp.]|jgi:hypothetical protein|nr:hypothetical protein [Candidatus Angelobacter sp.]
MKAKEELISSFICAQSFISPPLNPQRTYLRIGAAENDCVTGIFEIQLLWGGIHAFCVFFDSGHRL